MVAASRDLRAAQIEQFVTHAAHSHFMQSLAWPEHFGDERETFKHVITEQTGDVIGCSLVRRVHGRLTGEKGFVDGGPVFDSDTGFERHLPDLLAATNDCVLLRLRPYLSAEQGARASELLRDHGFHLPSAAEQSGYATTLVLDLTRSLSALEAEFSPHLRRNLRRTVRSGLVIERATDAAAYSGFAALLVRSAAAAGYSVPSAEPLAAFLDTLHRDEPRAGALFCAREQGRVRAGIVVLRAGSSLVYQWGTREESGDDNAPLTHALHFEAMEWAKAQSFRQYDFGGLFSPDGATGIDRFKRSFGGQVQTQFGEAIRRRGLRGWVAGRLRRAAPGVRREADDAAAP